MSVLEELIGRFGHSRISACVLKGVANASRLDVVAANGDRYFIVSIGVAHNELVVLVTRSAVDIEAHTVDRDCGARVENGARDLEARHVGKVNIVDV